MSASVSKLGKCQKTEAMAPTWAGSSGTIPIGGPQKPAIAPSAGMAAQMLLCSLTPGKITSGRTNGAIQVGSLADFSLEHP